MSTSSESTATAPEVPPTADADALPREAITSKILSLLNSADDIFLKIKFRKLLAIPVASNSLFWSLFVPVSATDIDDEIASYFTTSIDHLLSAVIKRPELFLPPEKVLANQVEIEDSVKRTNSHIDYSKADYTDIIKWATNVNLLLVLLDVNISGLQFPQCNTESVMSLLRQVISQDPFFEGLVDVSEGSLPDEAFREKVNAIVEAVSMIPMVFSNSMKRNPTTLCIVRDLLIFPPGSDLGTPLQVAKYLRHYFSPKLRNYSTYVCEDNLLQRAKKSYQRYLPMPLSERQDLAKFIAKMGLHSRREIFTADPEKQTDFAAWFNNFCVVLLFIGPSHFRADMSEQRIRKLFALVVDYARIMGNPTTASVTVTVAHWHKLYQYMVRWRFPESLLDVVNKQCVEYDTVNRADPGLLHPSRLWELLGEQRENPIESHQPSKWQPFYDALMESRRKATLSGRSSNIILNKLSVNKAVLKRNYEETLVNLVSALVDETQSLTPLGVWDCINAISNRYYQAINVAGSTAIIQAHAVSAPIFQMALSSFHNAGSAKSNSAIVRQIEEFNNVTKTESMHNPSLTIIPLVSDISYHDSIDLRAYFTTATFEDYFIDSQPMEVPDNVTYARVRINLNVKKMITTRVTPQMIVQALSEKIPANTTLAPSVLHEGYIDIYHDSGLNQQRSDSVIITNTIPILRNAVVKRFSSGDGIVSGVFPMKVDVWSKSISDNKPLEVFMNDGSSVKGTVVQFNRKEMPKFGITVERIKRLVEGITRIPASTMWLLPYYDSDSRFTKDPLMPAGVVEKKLPFTGYNQLMFIPHTDLVKDPVGTINNVKKADAIEEDEYEKYRQRVRLEKLKAIRDGFFSGTEQISADDVVDVDYIRPETRASKAYRSWIVETNGTNLSGTLVHPLCNPLYTVSNSVTEIENVLGICAASNQLLILNRDLIKMSDYQIDWSHLFTEMAYQSATGKLIPINHTGLEKSGFDVATRVSASHANIILAETTATGQVEPINSYASELMLGATVGVGTGSFDVVTKPSEEKRMKVMVNCLKGVGMGSHSFADEMNAKLTTDYIDESDDEDSDTEEKDEGEERLGGSGNDDDPVNTKPGGTGLQSDDLIQGFKGAMAFVDDDSSILPATDAAISKLKLSYTDNVLNTRNIFTRSKRSAVQETVKEDWTNNPEGW